MIALIYDLSTNMHTLDILIHKYNCIKSTKRADVKVFSKTVPVAETESP